MYLKKDLKTKVISHLTEHLFIMEQRNAKPNRIAECKRLISALENITLKFPEDTNQLELFSSNGKEK